MHVVRLRECSEDPNPTKPTNRRKEEKEKTLGDKNGESSAGQQIALTLLNQQFVQYGRDYLKLIFQRITLFHVAFPI